MTGVPTLSVLTDFTQDTQSGMTVSGRLCPFPIPTTAPDLEDVERRVRRPFSGIQDYRAS
jgi:hypothetical protein